MSTRTLLFILSFLFVLVGYSQTTGYDLSKIIIVEGASDPTAGITPKEESQLTADSTLDIVNWNVSFLGAEEMNDYDYGSRMEHIGGVAQKLVEINADVYALQEVVVDAANGNALNDLLDTMNVLAGSVKYAGIYSPYFSFWWQGENPDYPAQCLAYVWNTETVTLNNDSILLQDYASSNDFGYGRFPFLLDANVHINGKTQRYMFINNHLKASKGYSDMRAASMSLLKELLNVNFHANNVVLIGDFNTADGSGALGEIRDWGMYADDEEDGLADYVHAAGNKNNGIEHILISNELFDEQAYVPDYLRNIAISGTGVILSDHYAYETRLYVYEETGGSDPESNSLFSSDNSINMASADYQIIVDYVRDDPSISDFYNTTFKNTEYYFGASSYYSDFDIRSGKYYSGFSSWEEAVSTGIALALLPEKFPNATVDGTVYEVTFEIYGTSTSQETMEFVCTKDAPDPGFAWYKGNSSRQFNLDYKLSAYPNPVTDQLYVSLPCEIRSYSLINANGIKVATNDQIVGNSIEIDIPTYSKGLYMIIVKDINGISYFNKFLKE